MSTGGLSQAPSILLLCQPILMHLKEVNELIRTQTAVKYDKVLA